MNNHESSVVSGGKPKYEAPVVVDLAQAGEGRGNCVSGSADEVCHSGSTAFIDCFTGSSN